MSITQSRPTTKITRRWKLKSSAARPDGGLRAQTTQRAASTSRADRGWVFDKSANPGDGLGWPLVRAA